MEQQSQNKQLSEQELLISQHDQMKVILETLGADNLGNVDQFLGHQLQADSKIYLKKMISYIEPQKTSSLREKFNHFTPSTLDLLCSLLSFNPDNRLMAKDYLAFQAFSDIHSTPLKTSDVDVKINLSIDRKTLNLTEAEQLQFYENRILQEAAKIKKKNKKLNQIKKPSGALQI